MSFGTLLQIIACMAAAANAWALSGSQCVQPEEYESINFQLQSPSDDGAWVPPAEYSLLSFSLSHMEQREVFALGGQFRVERDGNAITPVFICEPGIPSVYHVGHYTVKCPEWAGQLIPLADYSLLSFSLSHVEQREVFALGGQFRVGRDGNAITPVFICEPGIPSVYHVGHYTVKCPEWAGQLIPLADYSLLSFSLSHVEQREVFALGGQFRVGRDGNAITPVFICEPGVPAVYHVGHYTVRCPEWAGQLIRIFSDETPLGDSGKIGVGRWEDECIRWRTREYSCHDRVKPPPPPPPPGPGSVLWQNSPIWKPSAGPNGARICHTQLFSYWSEE